MKNQIFKLSSKLAQNLNRGRKLEATIDCFRIHPVLICRILCHRNSNTNAKVRNIWFAISSLWQILHGAMKPRSVSWPGFSQRSLAHDPPTECRTSASFDGLHAAAEQQTVDMFRANLRCLPAAGIRQLTFGKFCSRKEDSEFYMVSSMFTFSIFEISNWSVVWILYVYTKVISI